MKEKYDRTGIFILNEELWDWAVYRAKRLGYESVSHYLFKLIEADKKTAKP